MSHWTNLPIDIVDLIMEAAYEVEHDRPPLVPLPSPLCPLSLVCWDWCHAARRLMFRYLKILRYSEKDLWELCALLDRNDGQLGAHVRSLYIYLWVNWVPDEVRPVTPWTCELLNQLLRCTPNLRHLDFNTSLDDSFIGDFSNLIPLPSVTRLAIDFMDTEKCDQDYINFIKQIISATPNVTYLELNTQDGVPPPESNFDTSRLPPVPLRLLLLSLKSQQMANHFHQLGIIDFDALGDVPDLQIAFGGDILDLMMDEDTSSPLDLLSLVGERVTVLYLQALEGYHKEFPLAEALALCPNLMELVIPSEFVLYDALLGALTVVPPKLMYLDIIQNEKDDYSWNVDDLIKCFTHYPDNGPFRPSTIRLVFVGNVIEGMTHCVSEELREELEKNGVSVVVSSEALSFSFVVHY